MPQISKMATDLQCFILTKKDISDHVQENSEIV